MSENNNAQSDGANLDIMPYLDSDLPEIGLLASIDGPNTTGLYIQYEEGLVRCIVVNAQGIIFFCKLSVLTWECFESSVLWENYLLTKILTGYVKILQKICADIVITIIIKNLNDNLFMD